MIIEAGGGPVGGPNSRDGVGFGSVDALRYSGTAGGGQAAVISDAGTQVASGDRLRYKIYPELDDQLSYVATYAALDLRFADGPRRVRRLRLVSTGVGEAGSMSVVSLFCLDGG